MLWTLRHRSVMCYYYCYYYCCPSSARTIPALALHLKHVPLCGDGRQRIKPSKRPSYTFRRMEFKSRDLCTWYRVLLSGLDGWAWLGMAEHGEAAQLECCFFLSVLQGLPFSWLPSVCLILFLLFYSTCFQWFCLIGSTHAPSLSCHELGTGFRQVR